MRDNFPNEQLMQLDGIVPWFVDIVNYLVAYILPQEASRSQKDKIKSDAKYHVWDDPYLWKFCSDQVGIMDRIGQPKSPPFSRIATTWLPRVSSAKEQKRPPP
ncbi:hypothetical protein CR513_24005, partial [Mucuna pruriens]